MSHLRAGVVQAVQRKGLVRAAHGQTARRPFVGKEKNVYNMNTVSAQLFRNHFRQTALSHSVTRIGPGMAFEACTAERCGGR